MALGLLGIGNKISALDENSAASDAISTHYGTARDKVFRDFKWAFAKKEAALPAVDNPSSEYLYAYRKPSDCIYFRHISNGVPYGPWPEHEIASDDIGEIILTNTPNAKGVYTKLVLDETRWPPDFVSMFALQLACKIGPELYKGENSTVADCFKFYEIEFNQAKANAVNENNPKGPTDNGFLNSRY